MRAWAHIVSASSVKHRDQFLVAYVNSIVGLVQGSSQAYDKVLTILDHDFFSLFTESVHLVHSSSPCYGAFTTIAVNIIDNIICPATIHREILR